MVSYYCPPLHTSLLDLPPILPCTPLNPIPVVLWSLPAGFSAWNPPTTTTCPADTSRPPCKPQSQCCCHLGPLPPCPVPLPVLSVLVMCLPDHQDVSHLVRDPSMPLASRSLLLAQHEQMQSRCPADI